MEVERERRRENNRTEGCKREEQKRFLKREKKRMKVIQRKLQMQSYLQFIS